MAQSEHPQRRTERAAWTGADDAAYLELVRRACFICELVAGNPDYPHHVAYRDDHTVVFLSRLPLFLGHLLVAPVAHREHVVGDMDLPEYLALQEVVHAAGRVLSELVPTERLYVLSLGSQQANRHIHWHLTPLPPGVPYEEQQAVALLPERGIVTVADETMADLAAQLGRGLAAQLADRRDVTSDPSQAQAQAEH